MLVTNIDKLLKEWRVFQRKLYNMMTDKELIQIYTTWFQKEPESRDKDEILNELLGDECQYKKAYPYHQLKPLVRNIKKEIDRRK